MVPIVGAQKGVGGEEIRDNFFEEPPTTLEKPPTCRWVLQKV